MPVAPGGCPVPITLHELGHAIGMWHEQQRKDRDRWVTVFRSNIDPGGGGGNWHPQRLAGTDIGPYDYRSVMHYGFSSDDLRRHGHILMADTIPPGMPMGQTVELSPGDIDAVARLYGPRAGRARGVDQSARPRDHRRRCPQDRAGQLRLGAGERAHIGSGLAAVPRRRKVPVRPLERRRQARTHGHGEPGHDPVSGQLRRAVSGRDGGESTSRRYYCDPSPAGRGWVPHASHPYRVDRDACAERLVPVPELGDRDRLLVGPDSAAVVRGGIQPRAYIRGGGDNRSGTLRRGPALPRRVQRRGRARRDSRPAAQGARRVPGRRVAGNHNPDRRADRGDSTIVPASVPELERRRRHLSPRRSFGGGGQHAHPSAGDGLSAHDPPPGERGRGD